MTRNGTALTTVTPFCAAGPACAGERTTSAFAAQLLAMRHDSPEYRQRRRIEPAAGVSAYLASLGRARQGRQSGSFQA